MTDKSNTAGPVPEALDDLYLKLHGLSKRLEGSGRIDESDAPEAYPAILDAMKLVRSLQCESTKVAALTAAQPVAPAGWTPGQPITEAMHVAAVKVLHRAPGVDGLPQRMLDAMLAAACETCRGRGMIGGPSFNDPGEGGVPCPDCAQQPTPSAAPAVGEAPLPLLVRDIAADLGTTPIQVCTALATLGFGGHSVNMAVTPRMAQSLRAHFASPTPQADSQPAPAEAMPPIADPKKCTAQVRCINGRITTESCTTKAPLISNGESSDGERDYYICPDCRKDITIDYREN